MELCVPREAETHGCIQKCSKSVSAVNVMKNRAGKEKHSRGGSLLWPECQSGPLEE